MSYNSEKILSTKYAFTSHIYFISTLVGYLMPNPFYKKGFDIN